MFLRKKSAFFGTMALTLVVGFMIGQVGKANTPATPGSADDPIVTKSYIDSRIAELNGGVTPTPGTSSGFSVITVQPGQTIKASSAAGLEVIVRSGNPAVVLGSRGDGLSDLTVGSDLNAQGQAVGLNHLIVLARNDGRGVKFNSSSVTAYVLVRGAYTLQ